MKTQNRNPLPTFTSSLVVAAVRLEFFTRMVLMGRRKRTRYLNRTFFQQSVARRR